MAFKPYDRNPSGIVFFGTAATDPLYDSVSTFTYDTGNNALKIANGGYIGSQSDFDAIAIASNGNVTLSQSLSIAGNLTVNGTTTTVNSTTVTVEDPIIFLGSGAPTTDDNKDRGIAFNWHTGSVARSGFFGFDDSTGGFTFIPVATLTNEVISGTAGWATFAGVSGALAGNASTATILATARNFSVTGNMTANVVSFDGSANVVLTGVMHPTAISDRTEITSVEGTLDYLLIWDATDSGLKRINRTNFITGLGSMSSFTISDGTTTQTISDSETLFFRSGPAISFTVSATDQVSGTLNAGVAGVGLSMSNQVLAVDFSEFNAVAVASGDSFATLDSDGATEQRTTISDLGSYLASQANAGIGVIGDGKLTVDFSEFSAVSVASGDSFATLDSDGANEQRTTVSDLGSYFASHPQGGIGVLGDGKLTIDLSEFPSISVASGDSFATLDSNGSTEQLTSVSDLGIYFASQANAGIGVLGDGKLTIDLSEFSTVAFASGDSFLVLDSDGSTEQRGTVTQLGAYMAGTNVTAGGDGKLSVTDATIEGVVFTSANFVDGTTIDFTATAGQSVTAEVKTNSISETYLTTSVAGVGLAGGNGTALTIDLSEYVTPQAVASGDSFLMLDSDGSTEQRSTVTQLAAFMASTGLADNGAGALTIDLNEYSSVNIASGDRLFTLDSDAATEQLTTVVQLAQFMAGNGLGDSGAGALVVNVDNSTVEINSDALRIKDSGVTEVKRSRTSAAVSTSVTLSNDINLCTAGAGGITVTLPAVITGKVVHIKKVDSAAGTVTVQRGGSSTIDGATTVVLYHQWESMTVACDGTNWFIL